MRIGSFSLVTALFQCQAIKKESADGYNICSDRGEKIAQGASRIIRLLNHASHKNATIDVCNKKLTMSVFMLLDFYWVNSVQVSVIPFVLL